MGFIELNRIPKQVIEHLLSLRYNYISKKSAFAALQQIQHEKGKLDPKIKTEAYVYAKEVLGSKKYAPWLYVYAAISGEFRKGWLPDNYYRDKVIPKVQGDYGKISFLKSLNNRLFNYEMSPDLAYYINGKWLAKDLITPLDADTLQQFYFKNNAKVVFKLDQSFQGKGIFVFTAESFNRTKIEAMGNGTLQAFIVQHAFFNQFSSQSVANLRMTTVIDKNGRPSLRACYLRFGRSTDSHVKSSNHIRVSVDLYTGALSGTGYLANWKTITYHPDTKIVFAEKIIPQYQKCVDLVLKLHRNLPIVQSIGWDIAIDHKNDPKVMEWNGYGNDIKFSEATQGPCFFDLNWQEK